MIIGCVFLSILGGLIKSLSTSGMPVFEIVFLRNMAGLIALAPWFLKYGVSGLKTGRPGLFLVRGIFGFVSMVAWFYAVTVIPLAEAVALNFTAPIFGTLLAIVVLQEVVRFRRWMAILVGFVGAMIILRPGVIDMSTGAYAALLAAATMACSVTCVKMLSGTESTPSIVAWTQIIILPMSFIPAMLVWVTPSWDQLMLVAGMGLSATLGHLFFTRSFAVADATYVLPFDFFRLVFSAIIGALFFAQDPSIYVWVGASIIFASSVYIAMREARLSGATGNPKSVQNAKDAASKVGESQ
ncbi:DMT family transporter [Sneathiella aquimaris]|uniref:DMT family transporter n=1 Tax=Sneathiella aquimaris TaxID=2599305 RepID=UPI00146C82AC|nr:DMT family transporter [Sneathiella aquimaris]